MPRLLAFFCLLACPSFAAAQVFDEQFDHWPVDLRIEGRILLAGRLDDPAILRSSLRRVRRDNATLVFDEGTPDCVIKQYCDLFEEVQRSADEDSAPPAGDSQQSDGASGNEATPPPKATTVRTAIRSKDVTRRIADLLRECDVLFWYAAANITPADRGALIEQRSALVDHIAGGGTLIAVGEAAEFCAKFFYTDDSENPAEIVGLNLLPDCVVETGYGNGARDQSRLLSILAAHPRSVGIGLEDNTVLTLVGRQLSVTGTGRATCLLMANERQPIRSQTIIESHSRKQPESEYLVDLTQWRREAIDRTLPAFPSVEPATPNVENGTLVIVGGGGMPEGLMARIVELAGGTEEARMVYVPCSERDELSTSQQTVESWKRMGVKHATFIHTKDRHKANSDDEFLAPLKEATGIWFGGGRQWNFSDSYYGTKAHELMKDVLRRGGVIGGSSAGASIQARYLARATPIDNVDIMAPGYERGGLGFIDGVAIDQHFSQRGRQKDMTQLVDRYPQLLGIGIDEATAIVVQKSIAEVVGRGRVYFYDRNLPVYPDRPDYIALPAGSTFDLAERRVLVDATAEQTKETQDTP